MLFWASWAAFLMSAMKFDATSFSSAGAGDCFSTFSSTSSTSPSSLRMFGSIFWYKKRHDMMWCEKRQMTYGTYRFGHPFLVLATFFHQFSNSSAQTDNIVVNLQSFQVMNIRRGHKFYFRFFDTDWTSGRISCGHFLIIWLRFTIRHICYVSTTRF